ncbi:MAG TPA: hypothetical protein VG753_00685 [Candidatus Paceibacterota bacterium]|nr:hypothetical protein [Candidatus Paceibacterota bacterium]
MPQASGLKKKFLAIGSKAVVFVALLAIVFSPVGQVFQAVTYAAGECAAYSNNAPPTDAVNGKCPAGYYDPSGKIPTDSTPGASIGTVDNKQVVNSFCNDFGNCLAQIVYVFTAGLGGWVAGVASFIFNTTVQLSLSSTAYAQGFLNQGWATSRDLANMFFILILIYIAVTVVLKADTHGTVQSLVWVIFIALIINFSFFFTRVVIDAGNFAAVQFYDAIQVPPAVQQTASSQAAATLSGKKDLAAAIMQGLGVTNILSSNSFKAFQADNKDPSFLTEFITLSVIYLTTGIMLFVLAAGLAAAAIKFLIRVATLWIVIVVSPLALVASAMPPAKKYFDQWRDALIANAFFPVAFLFIFWIITLFASGLSIDTAFQSALSTNPASTTGTTATATTGIETLLNLIAGITIRMGFVITLIFLGLRAADQVGIMGAQLANNWGNKLSFGGTAWLGRQTVGRAGLAATRSEALRDFASKNAFGAAVFRSAGALSQGSFDLRSLPGAGKLKGQLGAAEGKGGIAKSVNDKDKKREHAIEEFGKSLNGDAIDEQKAQEKYIRDTGGKNAYDARVNQIRHSIEQKHHEADEARMSLTRATTDGERASAKSAITAAEKAIKGLQGDLGREEGAGKRIVKESDHERAEHLAERLTNRINAFAPLRPSRGTLKGIAGLTHHETTKDKLEKAVKEAAKEDREAEGGGTTAAPAPTAAAPAAATPAATAHEPATPAHPPEH